ncbi:MAG: hypothetical protein ABJB11_09985 [Ferruginibacter sp.]
MQENNFEKQVQQKMEEFRVTPASEVWQKVELEIIRKKRNWRVLLVIAFSIILLGTAGIGWWNYSFTPATNKLSTINHSQSQPQNVINDSLKKYSENSSNTPGENHTLDGFSKKADDTNSTSNLSNKIKKQERQLSENNTKETAVKALNVFEERQEMISETVLKSNRKIKGKTKAKTNTSISNGEIEDAPDDSIFDKQNQVGKTVIYLPKIDRSGILLSKSINKREQTIAVKNDSSIVQLKAALQNLQEQLLVTTENKVVTANSKKSRWQFGLNLSFGISTTRNSYLGIPSTGEDKVFADPSQVNSGTGGTANAGVPQQPSAIKSGKAFVIGAFAKRSLSPRLSILTGINYKFYSTNMFIGSRFDSSGAFSSVASYYRSGSSINYNNHFHFIEIPFSLQWKISKQSKLPLYINAGFTVTQLVNTNALQYNSSTGYYYKDNSFFKNTSVNISSKLLIDISKHNSQRFLLGPELNFNIGSMSNNGFYQKKHYSYLGISLQKAIGKK